MGDLYDIGYGSAEYNGVEYFVLEDIQPNSYGECCARAVASDAEPDEDGYYPCVYAFCVPENDVDFEIERIDDSCDSLFDADNEELIDPNDFGDDD